MKITASRKDDILRRKAEYEKKLSEYEERKRLSDEAFHQAEYDTYQPIKQYILSQLSQFDALQFHVSVERGYRGYRKKTRGAQVHISCNEINKFDENVALAWSYDVQLDGEGNVLRDSSSWSGLKVTTPAQLNSIKQTVSAVDMIYNMDWKSLLDVDNPKYDDYYDTSDVRPKRDNFEAELAAAELEDIVGEDKIIKVRNWGESCPYRGDVYLKLLRETPAMYEAYIIPTHIVDKDDKIYLQKYLDGSYGSYRVRKSSVKPYQPIDVREV